MLSTVARRAVRVTLECPKKFRHSLALSSAVHATIRKDCQRRTTADPGCTPPRFENPCVPGSSPGLGTNLTLLIALICAIFLLASSINECLASAIHGPGVYSNGWTEIVAKSDEAALRDRSGSDRAMRQYAAVAIRKRVQRGKVTWQLDVRLPNGKRQRTSYKTKGGAENAFARLRSDILDGRVRPERRALTLRDAVDLWLEHAADKKTVGADEQRLTRAEEFFGERRLVATLQRADVVRYRAWLTQQPKQSRRGAEGETLSPATVNRHLAVLKSALGALVPEHLDANPARGVRMLREAPARDRVVDVAELERLVNAAHPDLRLAIILGIETGMRLGEIAGLEWGWINMKARTLRLPETKNSDSRTVALSRMAVEALAATPRRIRDGEAVARVLRLKRWTLSRYFSLLAAELGMRNLRFHDLRHTAATELRRSGADLFVIMRQCGWRSMAAARRYQHVTPDDLVEAVDRRTAKRPK